MQPAWTSRLCAQHLPALGAHQSSLLPASHLNESSPDMAPRDTKARSSCLPGEWAGSLTWVHLARPTPCRSQCFHCGPHTTDGICWLSLSWSRRRLP